MDPEDRLQEVWFQSEENKFHGQRYIYSIVYVLALLQPSKIHSKIGQRGQFLYYLITNAVASNVKATLAWDILGLNWKPRIYKFLNQRFCIKSVCQGSGASHRILIVSGVPAEFLRAGHVQQLDRAVNIRVGPTFLCL